MNRIYIIGTSGSGKTSLAIKLNKLSQLPYYDLDEYYWLPNWQPKILLDFQTLVEQLTENSSWIICGNYSQVRDMILAKADTVIWLDYSLSRCMLQAFYRTLKRLKYNKSCCNGNKENWRRSFFSKHSILWWIIKTYKRRKREYENLYRDNNLADRRFLRFSSPDEIKKWLASL